MSNNKGKKLRNPKWIWRKRKFKKWCMQVCFCIFAGYCFQLLKGKIVKWWEGRNWSTLAADAHMAYARISQVLILVTLRICQIVIWLIFLSINKFKLIDIGIGILPQLVVIDSIFNHNHPSQNYQFCFKKLYT